MQSLLKILVFFFHRLFFNELWVFIGTVFRSFSISEYDLDLLALFFSLLRLFWFKLKESPEDVQQHWGFDIIVHQFIFGKDHVIHLVVGQNIDLVVFNSLLLKLGFGFVEILEEFYKFLLHSWRVENSTNLNWLEDESRDLTGSSKSHLKLGGLFVDLKAWWFWGNNFDRFSLNLSLVRSG